MFGIFEVGSLAALAAVSALILSMLGSHGGRIFAALGWRIQPIRVAASRRLTRA